MLTVNQQIESGALVCPSTHQRLIVKGDRLETEDGKISYPLINGVPILFTDTARQENYLSQEKGAMAKEYAQVGNKRLKTKKSLKTKLINLLSNDYRNHKSINSFQKTISQQGEDALCLSIGGGPARQHPNLINLNIGHFANVDLIADAYELPYADNSVDAIFCEAVLEHLEFPEKAVLEMYRTLKNDSQAYIISPFMVLFHAYPNHFQNFTLIGHQRLFERCGFSIISAGTCVGPTVALSVLISKYFQYYFPAGISHLLRIIATGAGLMLRPLDRIINRNPDSHIIASTTYVHIRKQGKR